MSAAKLRAAAKLDVQNKKQAAKEAKVRAGVTNNTALWKDAFDSDQPLSVEDAASCYATWVSNGKQGDDAKEEAFEACKTFNGTRIG